MGESGGIFTKVILGGVVVAIALCIASLVLNVLILQKETGNQQPAVTTPRPLPPTPPPTISKEPGFKAAADLLLNGLDRSFNPCTDFYKFTCNKFIVDNPLPEGVGRIGTYANTQKKVNNWIAVHLNTTTNPTSSTEQILQKVFNSCMTLSTQGGANRLLQAMKDNFKGFPMLDPTWTENALPDADMWKGVGTLELHYGMGSLLQSWVGVDYKNITRNALFVGQLPLNMARDYYVKPSFLDYLDSYLNGLVEAVIKFKKEIGSTVSDETIRQEIIEATRLEVDLALASVPGSLLRNYQQQYNPYTLTELQVAYPNIGWPSYLSTLLEGATPSNDHYIIEQPSYFGALNTILLGKQFSKRAFVNFIMLRFLQDNLSYLGDGQNQYTKLYEIIRGGQEVGKKKSVPKWEDEAYSCVTLTEIYMPYSNGYVYVRGVNETLRNNIRKDVSKQTEYVIEEFLKSIETLPWLSKVSLKAAKDKAAGLIKNYGWPDWFNFTDSSTVDAYHKNYASILTMNDWWSISNQLKYAFQLTESFGLIEKKPDRLNFLQSPAMVNAWYQPGLNSITIPFAELNPPYYSYDYPQAFNYAGEGGTAGHELTHGYDDEGVQFGPEGALQPCTWDHCGWMDRNSTSGFINMAQCVVSQFSEQCCPLKTGNVHCASGERTQGENIADLGGQLSAYKAYRRYITTDRNGKEEDRLPGLEEFTPNQIFWITYGYSWCMNTSPTYMARLLMTNPHAPGECRVNQVMQDLPEFGKDFNCPSGAPMYPPDAQRCHVWSGN